MLLVEKSTASCHGGRFPPSFIHPVIIITGVNKLLTHSLTHSLTLLKTSPLLSCPPLSFCANQKASQHHVTTVMCLVTQSCRPKWLTFVKTYKNIYWPVYIYIYIYIYIYVIIRFCCHIDRFRGTAVAR